MTWLPWVMMAVVIVAAFAFNRGTRSQGKAEAFGEVADAWWQLKELAVLDTKERKDVTRQQRQAAFLRLALCDPRVRDAMWEALRQADVYWDGDRELPSELRHPREGATA